MNMIDITEQVTNKDFVTCQLCNKEFKQITWMHLKFSHNITVKDYRHQFPHANILSETLRIIIIDRQTNHNSRKGKHHNEETRKKWKGRIPINKGKTKYNYPPLKIVSDKLSGSKHPNFGKTANAETRLKISIGQQKTWTKKRRKKYSIRAKNDPGCKIGQFKSGPRLHNKKCKCFRCDKERVYRLLKERNHLKFINPNYYTDIEKIILEDFTELGLIINKDLFHNRMIRYDKFICVPDFIIPKSKIAIFCDGEYWHNKEEAIKRDEQANHMLTNDGWTVLRFPGKEIKSLDFKNELKERLKC